MEWSWSPYGTDHSMSIPYGIHGLYGMRKWLESQLNVIYGLHGMVHGVHGVQVHSIWINPGTVKTSLVPYTYLLISVLFFISMILYISPYPQVDPYPFLFRSPARYVYV